VPTIARACSTCLGVIPKTKSASLAISTLNRRARCPDRSIAISRITVTAWRDAPPLPPAASMPAEVACTSNAPTSCAITLHKASAIGLLQVLPVHTNIIRNVLVVLFNIPELLHGTCETPRKDETNFGPVVSGPEVFGE
jgi:hypothetical protein